MNNWGIPEWLEKEVRERDKACVYCGIQMIEKTPPRAPRKAVATWEHIINDESIITPDVAPPAIQAKGLSNWQLGLTQTIARSSEFEKAR